MLDAILNFLNAYREYVYLGMGLVVMWFMLKTILNKPKKEEREADERLKELKKKYSGRYRNLRPPLQKEDPYT